MTLLVLNDIYPFFLGIRNNNGREASHCSKSLCKTFKED